MFYGSSVTLNNVKFNVYADDSTSSLTFGMWTDNNCDPDYLDFRYFNFTNIDLTIFPSQNKDPQTIFAAIYIR